MSVEKQIEQVNFDEDGNFNYKCLNCNDIVYHEDISTACDDQPKIIHDCKHLWWHCACDWCRGQAEVDAQSDYELQQWEARGHSTGCTACLHPDKEEFISHDGCGFA